MKRSRITVSISNEVLDWITKQVDSSVYYNKSHAFEKIILDYINKLKDA